MAITPKLRDLKSVEKISKALGDKNRLTILQHLTKKGGFAQCAEIHDIIHLAQPSISHHMKILTEAGLVNAEKEGRHFRYTLNTSILDDYLKFLQNLKNF